MDVLETMRFVRGGISPKSLLPEMKHFSIKEGVIKSFNGIIALSSPIDFHVECMPLAIPLVNAIARCNDVMSIGMTDKGRLRVESGPFRTFVECADIEIHKIEPAGAIVPINGQDLLDAVKNVMPFIGTDAVRPWSNGMLLKGSSAFATNNVCLVEYWIGTPFPVVANIPIEALRELLRIEKPPVAIQMDENSITFHYENNRWLRSQLYTTEWPNVEPILNQPDNNLVPVPDNFVEALETIKVFLEKDLTVYLREGYIHTQEFDGLGASYKINNLTSNGIYKYDMLRMAIEASEQIDLSAYPNPCPFRKGRLRGVVLGMRP
jgi:hypothetical protein